MHVHKNLNAGETLKLMIKSTEVGAESFTFFLTKKPVRMRIGVYDIVEKKEVYLSEALSSDDNVDFSIDMSDKPASSLSPAQKTLHEELSKYFAGGLSIMLSSGKGKDPQGNDRQYVEAILITEQKAMKSVSNRLAIHFTPEEATETFSWVDYTSYDKAVGYTEGTASVSMGDCSTSGEAVTVGAWAASNRLKFSQQSDNILTDRSYTVGDIAYFSSYGTDYAGHRIPDVAAPGVYVNAALNSLLSAKEVEGEIISTSMPFGNQFVGQNADRIYYWRFASGTSMATPVVAGIVALWVQAAKDKGKTLTNADVKDIILHSSDTDEGTAKAPHRFGAGKINAYRGLLYVLDLSTGIEGLSQQQPENVSFRVETGQLIAEGAEDGTAVTLYNLSGTIVSRTAVHAGRISLDGLRKGVYAVQLGKLGSTLIRL
jgi:subtilisin family serine protease